MKFWKSLNLLILVCLTSIAALGTFYKHIAFGWGLGDLLWYGLMYIILIVHFILTLLGRNKSEKYHLKLSLTFLLLIVWICLEATIWRDTEYPWNGKIFYG